MKDKRVVIAHYHTFKNSGTSFDELLTANYGDAHLCFDGPFAYTNFSQPELVKIVRRHPEVLAFSSHSIRLPVPTDLWTTILAAVFVRHPILRIRSAYGFEMKSWRSKQQVNNAPTSKLLAKTFDKFLTQQAPDAPSFDDWINSQREAKDLHLLSNSQTQLFSGVYGSVGLSSLAYPRGKESFRISDLEQAKRNLRTVPLLARTENFERDVQRFPAILQGYGIEFEYRALPAANVTHPIANESLETRLKYVRDEVSGENWAWLLQANTQDQQLYDFAGSLV